MRLAGCRASSRRSATRVSGSVGCAVGLGPRDGQRGLLARILGHDWHRVDVRAAVRQGGRARADGGVRADTVALPGENDVWTVGEVLGRLAVATRDSARRLARLRSSIRRGRSRSDGGTARPAGRPLHHRAAYAEGSSRLASTGSRSGPRASRFLFTPAPDRRTVGSGLAPRIPARARIPPKRPHARKGDELQATWFAAWHTFHRDGTRRKD